MTASHEVLAIERNFWTEGPGFYRENVDATCLVVFKTMSAVMTNSPRRSIAPRGGTTCIWSRRVSSLRSPASSS